MSQLCLPSWAGAGLGAEAGRRCGGPGRQVTCLRARAHCPLRSLGAPPDTSLQPPGLRGGEGIEAPGQVLSHVTAPTRCRGVGGGVLPRCPVRAPTLTARAPRPQELDEAYQDAAGNVLVAICRHSWRAVAQHLEAEVLTGVFPHRSLLYVMGVLTSKRTSCPWVLRPPATLCHPPGLVRWAGHGETSRRGRAGKHVRGRGQWAADPAPHSALPSASRAGRDPAKGSAVQLCCPPRP